jgi:hypothetical protein
MKTIYWLLLILALSLTLLVQELMQPPPTCPLPPSAPRTGAPC